MQPGRQIADFTASYKRRADVRAKYGAGRNTCEPPGGSIGDHGWRLENKLLLAKKIGEHIVAGKENWTELKSTSGRRRRVASHFLG